jgi:hypothetical protein
MENSMINVIAGNMRTQGNHNITNINDQTVQLIIIKLHLLYK